MRRETTDVRNINLEPKDGQRHVVHLMMKIAVNKTSLHRLIFHLTVNLIFQCKHS